MTMEYGQVVKNFMCAETMQDTAGSEETFVSR